MAESILVTGKKISSMELVTNVTGNEKIPTGQPDDLAITPNQIADHTIARGDLASHEDLSQVEVSLGTQITDLENDVASADNSIRGLIAAEEGARIENDSELQQGLSDEAALRITADADLARSVSVISDNLSSTVQTFTSVELGVDPVTGVADGAYFNVRSEGGDTVAIEYQNVGGVATATGKSYPSGNYVKTIAEHTALPFKQGKSYALYERAQLDNGDIVKSAIDGNTNDPNVDMTGWLNIGNTGEVESIAELLAIPNPVNGSRVLVKSYHAGLGKGGGDFIYDSTKSTINDGGLIINGWVRILSSLSVCPEMWGAVSGQDCTEALQKAFDTRFKVELDEALYLTSKPVRIYDTSIVIGKGKQKSVIAKITSTATTGWSNVTNRTGTYNFSFIDAVLVVYPTTDYGYARHVKLEGFSINRKGEPAPSVRDLTKIMPVSSFDGTGHIPQGYGLYAPIVCESRFNDMLVSGSEYNVYCQDAWLNNWTSVTADGGQPWSILTGTSNTLTSCWATNASWNTKNADGTLKKNYSAYSMGGYYNNFDSCAADGSGRNGAPCQAIWRFRNGSGNSMTSIGIETAHAQTLFSVVGSASTPTQVIVSNLMTHSVYNKYSTGTDMTYRGLFQVITHASLTILSGDLRTEYTTNIDPDSPVDAPVTTSDLTKPTFATVADFSVLIIGALNCKQKITGVNNNSNNQVWLDTATCGVEINSGTTSLTYGKNAHDKTYLGEHVGVSFTERPIRSTAPAVLEGRNPYSRITLGSSTEAGTPYIDLKSSGTGNAYDARIIAEGGKSGVTGSAILKIAASIVELSGVGFFVVTKPTTTTDLANKSNAVNTDHKTLGFEVYCTDTQRFYKSTGSSATSVWRAMDDNTVVVTPL